MKTIDELIKELKEICGTRHRGRIGRVRKIADEMAAVRAKPWWKTKLF